MRWLGLAIAAVLAAPAAAQSAFLATPEAARMLADGQPWSGTRPNGDKVRITLRRDGTGLFEGPFTRAVTWRVSGEDICIRLGFPIGIKCIRFRSSSSGLVAYEAGSVVFTLSR